MLTDAETVISGATWAWVGVLVALGVLLLIVCACGLYCCVYRRRRQKPTAGAQKRQPNRDYESETNQ